MEPQKCRKERQEGELGPAPQAQTILGTPWEECGGGGSYYKCPWNAADGSCTHQALHADSKRHLWSVYW